MLSHPRKSAICADIRTTIEFDGLGLEFALDILIALTDGLSKGKNHLHHQLASSVQLALDAAEEIIQEAIENEHDRCDEE